MLDKKLVYKIILALSIVGLGLSIYLWNYQIVDKVIPCTVSGCQQVLSSDYSKIFGVPIATYGVFFYAGLFVISLQNIFIKHKLLDKMLLGLLLWGVIFSGYLRYLEFVKIEKICAWCWGSVAVILTATIVYFLKKK